MPLSIPLPAMQPSRYSPALQGFTPGLRLRGFFWSLDMNCKPGDLAVIVRSGAGHEGKIVRCLQFVGRVLGYRGDDYWEIDRPLPSTLGDMTPVFPDSWLRPIRDSDGEDETLTWAGKPQEVCA